MPSHTNHSALIKLHGVNGAPWSFPEWKKITGIRHGLFPDDDALLPPLWDRRMASQVAAYMDRFERLRSEAERMKFSAAHKDKDNVPGRGIWRSFVTTGWKNWRIHSLITQTLTASNQHPVQIMLADVKAGHPDMDFPTGEQNVPMALDAVGKALFGEEALNINGRVLQSLRPGLAIIVQRTWDNIRKADKRNRNNLRKLEDKALRSFQALDQDRLKKTSLVAVIKAVARWKDVASIYDTPDNMDKIEALEKELATLMMVLGAKRPLRSIKEETPELELCKVSREDLAQLAAKDVSDLLVLYEDHFNDNPHDDSSLEMNTTLGIDFCVQNGESHPDTGVEVESTLKLDVMLKHLDFVHNRPLFFNAYRHRHGLTPMTPGYTSLIKESPTIPPDSDRIGLFGYQVAAVHAYCRKVFSENPIPECDFIPGLLLADEVGLGKTMQAIAIIAVLVDVAIRQSLEENSRPLPPLLASRPYFGTRNQLPTYPVLIVCPGTLIAQWESELHVALNPQVFEVLVYPTSPPDRKAFWAAGGAFATPTRHNASRVILASQSVVEKEFASLYRTMDSQGPAVAWTDPKLLPNADRAALYTLFGQLFLLMIVDEAQVYRNPGNRHIGIVSLLKKSATRLILTATPLQTNTDDLACIGRLVGIPYFFTAASQEELLNDARELRQLQSIRPEEYDPLQPVFQEDQHKLRQIQIAQRVYHRFSGMVIRRTTSSLDTDGQLLVNLPPLIILPSVVKLTAREEAILETRSEKVVSTASTGNQVSRYSTSSFYLEHRKGVIFASEDEDSLPPHFETLDAWRRQIGTKVDVCSRLCSYLLSSDLAPPVAFEGGSPIFSPIPPPPEGQPIPQETKVLIYQEFTSMGALLQNVLSLYKVKYDFIDGSTTFKKRAAIVDAFNTDPSLRVLIISSVGGTGLNLARASVVIFLDQPWSAQDERQIRGRAHRRPQKRTVYSYHLLAANTADIALHGMAAGKKHLLESFLNTQAAKDLARVMQGETITEDDDDYDAMQEEDADAESEAKSTKSMDSRRHRSRVPSRKAASTVFLPSDSEGEQVKSKLGLTTKESLIPIGDEDVHMGGMSSDAKSDFTMGTDASSEHEMRISPPPEALPIRPQESLHLTGSIQATDEAVASLSTHTPEHKKGRKRKSTSLELSIPGTGSFQTQSFPSPVSQVKSKSPNQSLRVQVLKCSTPTTPEIPLSTPRDDFTSRASTPVPPSETNVGHAYLLKALTDNSPATTLSQKESLKPISSAQPDKGASPQVPTPPFPGSSEHRVPTHMTDLFPQNSTAHSRPTSAVLDPTPDPSSFPSAFGHPSQARAGADTPPSNPGMISSSRSELPRSKPVPRPLPEHRGSRDKMTQPKPHSTEITREELSGVRKSVKPQQSAPSSRKPETASAPPIIRSKPGPAGGISRQDAQTGPPPVIPLHRQASSFASLPSKLPKKGGNPFSRR